MVLLKFTSLLTIGIAASAYRVPHLPLNFKRAAVATGSALIGLSVYFGNMPPPMDNILHTNNLIVNAKESKSVFEGLYDDPNHPGCLRKIVVKDKVVTIIGSDELDGSNQWILQAKEEYPAPGESPVIFVDFSPKGGPADLLGVFDDKDNGIKWPDGNLWTKIKK